MKRPPPSQFAHRLTERWQQASPYFPQDDAASSRSFCVLIGGSYGRVDATYELIALLYFLLAMLIMFPRQLITSNHHQGTHEQGDVPPQRGSCAGPV